MQKLNLTNPIITIDLPAHGNSDHFADLSLDLYTRAIKELKAKLKLESLILCGHSLGGAVALNYYFNNQDDVNGLILMSTGAKLRVLPVILHNTINEFPTFLQNIPVGAFYRKTDDKIKHAYVEEVSKIKAEVVHTDFKICDNFDVIEKIDGIDVPTLIIVGKYDKLTPVKYSKFFHNNIQNSKLKVIDQAGHSVMIEKPKKVNQAIENYINDYF